MPQPQRVIIANEADPAGKLLELLRAVKYRPPGDAVAFRRALGAGDRDTVLAVLSWMLPQHEVLKRRALIGFYLTMPEVPLELRTVPVRSLLWHPR